jgi:hypothetical protein
LGAGLFYFAGVYAEIIDVANKEEKHDRTNPASRHRAGAGTVWAGNWGGYCAWIE